MIGTRLGSWIIDRELGRGGMGCVYLAHRSPLTLPSPPQEREGRQMSPSPPKGGESKGGGGTGGGGPEQSAIKILAPELAVESGFQARFRREIDILRQLDHPNIVRFLESGQQNGHFYFVMEYVAGPSFEALLEKQGRLPWPEVLDMAWQIAPALKHAHDRGIIHRDLKPSNLLRAPDSGDATTLGLVKLTDFGIASLFASPHLTVTGGIIGTAEYLSPEQAAGKPVTRRSDLYSLGIVLYTLLTGRTPFVGEPLDLLHKHRFGQFDRPARLVPEVPHELDDIVCQLLEKDPDKRPGDGMVLFRRLDSLKRKRAYQASHSRSDVKTEEYPMTQPATRDGAGREGPATLMSRLMRQELEHEKNGGPVRQFFHRPWVLVVLLAITVGLIAWAFWPPSAETLYRRGAELMKSEDPDDWETAWDRYLGPLLAKHPDTPHREEIERFRDQYEAARLARQASRTARLAGPMSEAQWFYQEGLRLRQQGDEDGARRIWQALVRAFQDVPSEVPWVRRAENELGQPAEREKARDRQWGPVRQAMRHARQLREQGKAKEADAILDALRDLYRNDKQAQEILKGE